METIARDLRQALRGLRTRPTFALLAVLVLALGIGANSAVFSVLDGVILRPLGYPDPGRLMFISSRFPALGLDRFWVSAPEFLELREWSRSFESLGAYRIGAVNLGSDTPSRPVTALVSDDLLTTLGVPPLRGRAFTRSDTRPGAEPVAVLSYELWRRSFSGDEHVLGRVVPVDGVPTRIVGIMPPGFDVHDERVELWRPLTLDPANAGARARHFLYLIGRLKRGVTLSQARVELGTLLAQWPQRVPEGHTPDSTDHPLQIAGLQGDVVGGARAALWLLQGAVGFVLLIACANLASLLLARAESRQKELAVRTALGASRVRLLRQFLTEGLVLALPGATLGLAVATAGLRVLLAANPRSIPRAVDIRLDAPVLLVTLGVAVATGIVFALAPLAQLTAKRVAVSLKESAAGAGAAGARVRNGLVAAEVALALVLVVGAGLLLRSVGNLLRVDAGFDRSHLVTFSVVLPGATYRDPQTRADLFDRLLARLSALPGVQAAAAMAGLPPRRPVDARDVRFEDTAAPSLRPRDTVDYFQVATTDYLRTMGIPIVQGRGFTPSDASGAPVVLVNQALVRAFFGGRTPVGRRILIGGPGTAWFTIIGVVKDVKQEGVDAKTGTEICFLAEQLPRIVQEMPAGMNVVMRTSLPADSLGASVSQTVRALDRSLPVVGFRTMDEVFAESVARPRFVATVLGVFAGLALLLAAAGTYGVLSYSVTRRRREIAIRMALGASRRAVLGLVLGQALRFTVAGVVVGMVAGLALTRLLQSWLFDLRPFDPATFAGVAGFVTVVAFVASVMPAYRAARVDPGTVLREP